MPTEENAPAQESGPGWALFFLNLALLLTVVTLVVRAFLE